MDGAAGGGDAELLSKTLQVEHKFFYFDFKENPRGRYLKISEKTTTSRSTIIVPESGIVWFVDLFNYYASNTEEKPASKELQMDTKTFFFDVGENTRGRFLKVAEAIGNAVRSTIIVPSGTGADDGWSHFRDILVQIHEELRVTVAAIPAQMSQPAEHVLYADVPVRNGSAVLAPTNNESVRSTARVLRAEQKRFFFDLGTNARGQYLRISEVIGGDRSAIILPASALEQFHETIGQFVKMLKSQEADSATQVK